MAIAATMGSLGAAVTAEVRVSTPEIPATRGLRVTPEMAVTPGLAATPGMKATGTTGTCSLRGGVP